MYHNSFQFCLSTSNASLPLSYASDQSVTISQPQFLTNLSEHLAASMSPGPEFYRIATSPIHGAGAFAHKHISSGTRILSEPGVLVSNSFRPAPTEICRLHRNLSHSQKAKYRGLVHNWPADDFNNLESEMSRLKAYPNVERELLRYTSDQHNAELVAKFWANCFRFRDEANAGHWRGIFLATARFNHSCVPNCCASWNQSLGREGELCVHALRNISRGEELLITYKADDVLFAGKQFRQGMLQTTYGFQCSCTACSEDDPDPVEDAAEDPVWNPFGDRVVESDTSREGIEGHMGRIGVQESMSEPQTTTLIHLYEEALTAIHFQGLQTLQTAKLYVS